MQRAYHENHHETYHNPYRETNHKGTRARAATATATATSSGRSHEPDNLCRWQFQQHPRV